MNEKLNNSVVALKYDSSGTPKVTAKDQGVIAEQILNIAKEHNIPLHEDPELTKLLASIDLGKEIPAELFQAVAEILTFIYKLSGREISENQLSNHLE